MSPANVHWSEIFADKVLKEFPDLELYTTAAGISPSGIVHFGNFRDVITSYAVYEALKKRGVKSRSIFSWDNFDRFRKVPANVPEEWKKYIGMPLSKVPSPEPGFNSYADYFQKPFEEAMEELGINLEYINQTEQYESGRYDDQIFFALKKRKEIAEIMLSFMSEKGKAEAGIKEDEYKDTYFPISVYSEFTGKDATKILEYDGQTSVTYLCVETGKTSTVDLSKNRLAKLAWKIDWPMRWGEEKVVFEPGGHDHASPGGSFDVASVIADKIFNFKKPVFTEYKFVGLQGGGAKMSGSKGNAVSPKELLQIYEPELLKWLYQRKLPNQAFSLAFDTEIYRQYDEYDREKDSKAIPFKQAVALGQIAQWNEDKVLDLVKDLKADYSEQSIKARLPKAKNWLEKYNPEEAVKLRESVNAKYLQNLDAKSTEQIKKLRQELEKEYSSVEELEQLVYSIPKDPTLTDKENAPAQKTFFKHLYNLLIGKDAGPRLSTFLWAVDRERVLQLLTI
jgi:lysyl-tRNA synthetase, class I